LKDSDSRTTRERRRAERRATADRRVKAAAAARERRAVKRRTGRDRRSESDWLPLALEPGDAADLTAERVLLAAALDARTRAYARYSGFKVGAALETVDGRIVRGCNIENATYGLTMCAERVALVKALSDGLSVFTRLAVVADTEAPTPPCGSCRQLLWEYCGDIDIILGNLNGPTGRFRLSGLLPLPFDARLLG
jgi:cytidine deaminase